VYARYRNISVVVSEPWCGLISTCPVLEDRSVTIGCYARYQWLAYLLQYNPVVTIVSSVEFLQEPGTRVENTPELITADQGPPTPEVMMTNYTIDNLVGGETLNYTCQIQYRFTARGYSPRNDYADNTLTWSRCSISETVSCKYEQNSLLFRLHVCTGMGMAGIPRTPREIGGNGDRLREYRGDGICFFFRGNPAVTLLKSCRR